jgi:hypothetical protein
LNTVDVVLTQFLNVLFDNDFDKVNMLVYNSFNKNYNFMSSVIPIDLYDKLNLIYINLCNSKEFLTKYGNVDFIFTANNQKEYDLILEESNLTESDSESENENFMQAFNIVYRNIYYSINYLIKLIIKKEVDKLDYLKIKLKNIESDLRSDKYNLDRNENLSTSIHMSNKEKKKIKKERRELKPIINIKLKDNIDRNTREEIKLNTVISDKENEIKNLEISLKNKSLNELNEIYSKSNISIKTNFSMLKLKKKNTNLVTNNVRYRRSFSTLNYNQFNNELETIENGGCFSGRASSNISGINQIITEITTNPMYVKINQILNSSVDPSVGLPLNNRDKQLQIEETLRFFWNQELSKLFKGKNSLFRNAIGINILMNSISKLDKVLNTIKEDKRYLKNKRYRNHIMISDNGIIVSIVLSNIIPHMMKYKSNQNTATLFERIGKDFHKILLYNEWYKYDKTDNDIIYSCCSLEQNNNNFYAEIEKGLSKEDFYIRLDEILGIISTDDYFRLGCDLAEIISENSNMFTFMNVKNDEDNTVQRVVVPGKELDDQIIKLLAVDSEKLIMICEPSK